MNRYEYSFKRDNGKMQSVHAIAYDSMSDFAANSPPSRKSEREQASATKFAGGDHTTSRARLTEGDLSMVAPSDAFLSKFENLVQETARNAWRDDVCGSIPNVPAFIAGHPLAMRRRTREACETAPITVFCDAFASYSFSLKDITTRGAAVLALVRILSTRRAVTLYVGCTSHNHDGNSYVVAVRMDTQPLDLARAAYALASPLFLRRPMADALKAIGCEGSMAAPTEDDMGSTAQNIAGAITADGPAIIAPAMIGHADVCRNPEAWIIAQIRAAAPEMLPEVE